MTRALLLAASALLLAAPATAQTSPLYPAGALIDQMDVTLDANGDGTWTYQRPFAGIPVVAHMPKAANTSDPVICNWTSVTATAVTIHCWRANVLSGLLTGLFNGVTTGLKVTIVARYIP